MPKPEAAIANKMPKFKNREEAKTYLGYMKPLYAKVGVELTDAKMEEILDKKPEGNRAVATEIMQLDETQKRFVKQYSDPDRPMYDSTFSRVFDAMLKIGDDAETQAYNQNLMERAKTVEGQLSIVLEAVEMETQFDMKLVSLDEDVMLKNYRDHYREFNLSFISDNVNNFLNKAVADQKLAADDPRVVAFQKRKLALEDTGRATQAMDAYRHPLAKIFPENLVITENLMNESSKKDFLPGIPDEARKYISNYIASEFQRNFTREADYKAAFNQKLKNEGYQVQNVFTHGEIVLDEKNKPLEKDAYLEYGMNYLVMSRDGKTRGFRFKKGLEKIDVELMEAKIPDHLIRKQTSSYWDAFQYLALVDQYSDKVDGILGKKIELDPAFAQLVPNLQNCDYELPEGVSEEAAECIIFGALMNPELVSKMDTTSTAAKDSVENKTDSLAVDWITNNDERYKGAETPLIAFRTQLPDMLAKAAKGDNAEAKKAFAKAAEVFGKTNLESNDFKGSNQYIVFPYMMCEKLAKVIEENPYGIADGLDGFVKSAVLMRAHASKIYRQGANATAMLLSTPNLPTEKKQECLKQIVAAKALKELQKKHFTKVDLTQEREQAAQELGDDEDALEYMDNMFVYFDKPVIRNARFYNPSNIDLALAQKPEELLQAVEQAIPEGKLAKLAELPPEILAGELENLTIDQTKFVSPEVEKMNAPEGLVDNYKKQFVEKVVNGCRQNVAVYEEMTRQNALKLTDAASSRWDTLLERMQADIARTGAGMTGSSKEFKAVENAIAQLGKTDKQFKNAGMYSILASKVVEAGNAYLAKKRAEGIGPDTQGRKGERFKNVSQVIERAAEMAQFSKNACENNCKDTAYADKDMLTFQDCSEIVNLRERLILGRNLIDMADPFYIKSSEQFKEIQQTLNHCIDLLGTYGKNGFVTPVENAELTANFAALEAQTTTYMIEKAHPSSNHGLERMFAITKLHDVIASEGAAMKTRDDERQQDRAKVREQAGNKQTAQAEQKKKDDAKAKADAVENAKLQPYNKRMQSYETFSLDSGKFDLGRKVACLAQKVRINAEFLNFRAKHGVGVFTSEKNITKSLLADRMIADMIVQERAQYHDSVFEKAYVANPARVKKALMKTPENMEMMSQFLSHHIGADAHIRNLEQYDAAISDNLEAGRNYLIEKARESEQVKEELQEGKQTEMKQEGPQVLQ